MDSTLVMGRTHALSGAVVMLAAAPVVATVVPSLSPHGPLALTASVVVAAGAALLPDLDHPSSTIARSLHPLTTGLAHVVARVSGGHRHGTHSVVGVLAAAGLFGLLGSAGGWAAWVPVTVLAGLAVAAVGVPRQVTAWAGTAVLVAGGVAAGVDFGSWLGVAVGLGTAAHVAGDCATVQGCPLLWPRPRRYHYANLVTNHRGEHVVATGLVVVLVAEVWLSGAGQIMAGMLDQTGAIR